MADGPMRPVPVAAPEPSFHRFDHVGRRQEPVNVQADFRSARPIHAAMIVDERNHVFDGCRGTLGRKIHHPP